MTPEKTYHQKCIGLIQDVDKYIGGEAYVLLLRDHILELARAEGIAKEKGFVDDEQHRRLVHNIAPKGRAAKDMRNCIQALYDTLLNVTEITDELLDAAKNGDENKIEKLKERLNQIEWRRPAREWNKAEQPSK